MSETENEEYWNIKSSVEDLAHLTGQWEPPPEEIEKLYAMIDKNAVIQLQWQCPGYRTTSPSTPTTPVASEPVASTQAEEKDDFDFMDEMSSPSLRVRREGEIELKGSAKKKTTSLDGVLSNMRRHWRLAQMEKENPTTTETETKPS
ncbi:PAXIP1-associated glutamate-rich protein 1-like [Chrysoperla carnea]|uniref:PAXIP1-associated glutamate-rich protein 1-like n=1 Tax=Chrysoperla carnea TaxID=189513 RepID=UPI001D07386F|nr:PAXIP1-associated glutamate-rich protein 1-like [Chrysoperla carnea]